MKRSLFFLAMAVVAFGVGCKYNGPTPTKSFQEWMAGVEKCDVDQMKAGMTAESVKQLDQLGHTFASFLPEEKQKGFSLYNEICKGFKPGTIEIKGEKIDGEKAVLSLMSDGKEQTAPMIVENGSWKLDFAGMMQDSLKAMAPKKAEEVPAEAAAAPEAAPAEEKKVEEVPAEAAAAPEAAPTEEKKVEDGAAVPAEAPPITQPIVDTNKPVEPPAPTAGQQAGNAPNTDGKGPGDPAQ